MEEYSVPIMKLCIHDLCYLLKIAPNTQDVIVFFVSDLFDMLSTEDSTKHTKCNSDVSDLFVLSENST